MKLQLKAKDVIIIGISAALYAVFGILTANLSFQGVGFLPAVVIPAVFAVLYGPWVGGLGGAIGIFVRDMFVHGNAALSVIAGVPANFLVFFLIGYLSTKDISLKKALTGLVIVAVGMFVSSLVFLPEFTVFTGLSSGVFLLTFVLTVLVSLGVIALVAVRWKEWRSFAIGAILAQALGAALLSVTVWLVSPLFLPYFGTPFAAAFIIPLFVWTFATEVPFVLLVGPPIIKACYKAFPSLKAKRNT